MLQLPCRQISLHLPRTTRKQARTSNKNSKRSCTSVDTSTLSKWLLGPVRSTTVLYHRGSSILLRSSPLARRLFVLSRARPSQRWQVPGHCVHWIVPVRDARAGCEALSTWTGASSIYVSVRTPSDSLTQPLGPHCVDVSQCHRSCAGRRFGAEALLAGWPRHVRICSSRLALLSSTLSNFVRMFVGSHAGLRQKAERRHLPHDREAQRCRPSGSRSVSSAVWVLPCRTSHH